MEQMIAVARLADAESISDEDAAQRIVDQAKAKKQRLSGFGHRVHTDDPRTKRLLAMAGSWGSRAVTSGSRRRSRTVWPPPPARGFR